MHHQFHVEARRSEEGSLHHLFEVHGAQPYTTAVNQEPVKVSCFGASVSPKKFFNVRQCRILAGLPNVCERGGLKPLFSLDEGSAERKKRDGLLHVEVFGTCQ